MSPAGDKATLTSDKITGATDINYGKASTFQLCE